MGEVRASERRLSVEDVMYLCIVEKFVSAGVDMLPPLDGIVDIPLGDRRMRPRGERSPTRAVFSLFRYFLCQRRRSMRVKVVARPAPPNMAMMQMQRRTCISTHRDRWRPLQETTAS